MDCLTLLKNKYAGKLDEDALLGLFEEAKRERAQMQKRIGSVGDLEEKLLERLQGRVADAELIAKAHRRAAMLQLTKRLDAFNFVMQNFHGREEEGLSALIVGSNRTIEGARNSIDANQSALKGWYLGGLSSDLKALSQQHFDIFRKGGMDEDIARALWSLDNPKAQKPGYAGPKEALEIAQVIRKWQERARTDMNKAGAWTGKLEGYIVRQTHDRAKIYKAGYQIWRDTIAPLLDWERIRDTQGDGARLATAEGREEFLAAVYRNLAIGREKQMGGNNPLTGGLTSSRIGSKAADASEQRVLHFKGPDEWFKYNLNFGARTLRDAVTGGLSSAADDVALMRALGPSPQANFQQLYNMVYNAKLRAGDDEGVRRMEGWRRRLENRLREVDGSLRDHGQPQVAAVGRWVRAFQNVTKLGGAVLSSFTDIPVASSEIAYQGGSFLGSLGRQLADLVTAKGRGTVETQRIMAELGVFFDTMNGDILARVAGDESAGAMSRLQALFFRLNGLSWWTDSFRRSVGLMMAHSMALERQTGWKQLKSERRRVLGMYGLGEAEWELMRRGGLSAADGREYLTPEAFETLPEADVRAYLESKGKTATAARIRDTREELAQKLRTFYRDRINFAVLEPDAKTRAILHQGTSTGTWLGETARCVTQFKSFPVAFIQKIYGREVYGREGGWETARGVAAMVAMTTLFGYGSMVAKDLAKGKTPRDPRDRGTWLAALMQGGGLGIYGDFVFGNFNRFGGSLASSLAGPTFGGTVSDISALWERVRSGDTVAQSALRFAVNSVPGNNLWYARSAFDYTIGYALFEALNPGYFKRMKRRAKKENGQTYWAKPVGW